MIKKFEQFEFNEDWEEEDPNKGPYDDILRYGRSGPLFNTRCRVKYIGNIGRLIGKTGTITNYNRSYDYDVWFDDDIRLPEDIGYGVLISSKNLKLLW